MRVAVLAVSLSFVSSCTVSAPPPVVPTTTGFVEATATRSSRLLDDAVGVELMRAAVELYDRRRRIALENLANVETVAWKRRVVRTTTQTITGPDGVGYSLPVALAIEPVLTAGALEHTGRNLDLAIDGEGYFAVVMPDGRTGYSRAGVLQLNADGKLNDPEGRVLVPEITVPSDALEVAIDPEGRVSCRTAGSPDTMTLLGQLMLHRFVNPAGLRSEGSALAISDASGQPITGAPGSNGLGLLKQGFCERSNVQVAYELLELQTAERQHQALLEVLRGAGVIVF